MKVAPVLVLALGAAACGHPDSLSPKRTPSVMNELDNRPPAAIVQAPKSEAPPFSGRYENVEFDEVGVGRSLSHESQDTAVARAREDALSKAMMGAAGVFYGFSDFTEEIGGVTRESVAKYLFTSNQGFLTENSAGSPACEVKEGATVCRLRVRGKISFRGAVDPSYLILDQQSGRRLGLDRRQYYDGEQVKISLTVAKDSYIYIFSWDPADDLYLVFPSPHDKNNRLSAGSPLSLPHENSGVNYRAQLPSGKASATERLLIIAAQKEILIPDAAAQNSLGAYKAGTMTALMQRLALLERREWTLQVIPYDITAR
jgi:hypothetical protein